MINECTDPVDNSTTAIRCALVSAHHPVMKSFERGEDWGYCYVEQLMLEPAPRPRAG